MREAARSRGPRRRGPRRRHPLPCQAERCACRRACVRMCSPRREHASRAFAGRRSVLHAVLVGVQRGVGGVGPSPEGKQHAQPGGRRAGGAAQAARAHRAPEGPCSRPGPNGGRAAGVWCMVRRWAAHTHSSPRTYSVAARPGPGTRASRRAFTDASQKRLRQGGGAEGGCAQQHAAPCSMLFGEGCGRLWSTRSSRGADAASGKTMRGWASREGREAAGTAGQQTDEPEASRASMRRNSSQIRISRAWVHTCTYETSETARNCVCGF